MSFHLISLPSPCFLSVFLADSSSLTLLLILLFPEVPFLTLFSHQPLPSLVNQRLLHLFPYFQHHRLLKSRHAVNHFILAWSLLPSKPVSSHIHSVTQRRSLWCVRFLPFFYFSHLASHWVLSVLLSKYLLAPSFLPWFRPSPYFASITAVVSYLSPTMLYLLHWSQSKSTKLDLIMSFLDQNPFSCPPLLPEQNLNPLVWHKAFLDLSPALPLATLMTASAQPLIRRALAHFTVRLPWVCPYCAPSAEPALLPVFG